MTPWKGAAHPATVADFDQAARDLEVDVSVIRALWKVEAAGRPFRKDGSLERRFEPHHMKPPQGDWRKSMALSLSDREAAFSRAYSRDPDAALRATSWGGPQIMGFNAEAAGYSSAAAMVEAMSHSEGEQLTAFVRLVKSWGLAAALGAHDWHRFATRYNGKANADAYAAKLESAYRKQSGSASPVVLKIGSEGAEVRRLQDALGLKVDGHFGPETKKAVEEFQRKNGLYVDGMVGAKTWPHLTSKRGVVPEAQPTRGDVMAKATELGGVVTVGAGALATVGSVASPWVIDAIVILTVAIGFVALGAYAWRKFR